MVLLFEQLSYSQQQFSSQISYFVPVQQRLEPGEYFVVLALFIHVGNLHLEEDEEGRSGCLQAKLGKENQCQLKGSDFSMSL